MNVSFILEDESQPKRKPRLVGPLPRKGDFISITTEDGNIEFAGYVEKVVHYYEFQEDPEFLGNGTYTFKGIRVTIDL